MQKSNGKDAELCIDHPFQVRIEHPNVDVKKMFRLSQDLDFHEVRQPDPALERIRHELVVDVLVVKPNETLVEIKPRRPMTYTAIAEELEEIITHMSGLFKGAVKVVELDWLVERKGLASDQRSTQRRVM